MSFLDMREGLRVKDDGVSVSYVISKVAPVITAHAGKRAQDIVAEYMVRVCDSRQFREGAQGAQLLFAARDLWFKEQAQLFPLHHTTPHPAADKFDPLNFLMVLGESASGRVLVYPFMTNDEYADVLMKTGVFEEYGYSAISSHRPANVTIEEWEVRRCEWESVLDEEAGLGYLPMWQLDSFVNPFEEGFVVDFLRQSSFNEEDFNERFLKHSHLVESPIEEIVRRLKAAF